VEDEKGACRDALASAAHPCDKDLCSRSRAARIEQWSVTPLSDLLASLLRALPDGVPRPIRQAGSRECRHRVALAGLPKEMCSGLRGDGWRIREVTSTRRRHWGTRREPGRYGLPHLHDRCACKVERRRIDTFRHRSLDYWRAPLSSAAAQSGDQQPRAPAFWTPDLWRESLGEESWMPAGKRSAGLLGPMGRWADSPPAGTTR
jgi:hypothetical protein